MPRRSSFPGKRAFFSKLLERSCGASVEIARLASRRRSNNRRLLGGSATRNLRSPGVLSIGRGQRPENFRKFSPLAMHPARFFRSRSLFIPSASLRSRVLGRSDARRDERLLHRRRSPVVISPSRSAVSLSLSFLLPLLYISLLRLFPSPLLSPGPALGTRSPGPQREDARRR